MEDKYAETKEERRGRREEGRGWVDEGKGTRVEERRLIEEMRGPWMRG